MRMSLTSGSSLPQTKLASVPRARSTAKAPLPTPSERRACSVIAHISSSKNNSSENPAWASLLGAPAPPIPDIPPPGMSLSTYNGIGGALSADPRCLLGTIPVTFTLKYKTEWGQGVKIIGSDVLLGNWSVLESPELKYTPGDRWTITLNLAPGVVQYKYVIVDYESKQPMMWQSGSNSVLGLEPGETGPVEVEDNWPNSPGSKVTTPDGVTQLREEKLIKWGNHMMKYYDKAQEATALLQQKATENTQMKSELAQTKMELSVKKRENEEMSAKITELQNDCLKLKMDLTATQMEMNSTLAEALKMLQDEMETSYGDNEEEDKTGFGMPQDLAGQEQELELEEAQASAFFGASHDPAVAHSTLPTEVSSSSSSSSSGGINNSPASISWESFYSGGREGADSAPRAGGEDSSSFAASNGSSNSDSKGESSGGWSW